MVFSTIIFLFRFLPIALFIYYVLPPKFKNFFLFIISLIFYSWGEVKYFPIMIASTIVDFTCGHYIGKFDDNEKKRKIFLIISMIFNLGMLFYFKYTDFFLTNLNTVLGTSIPLLELTLPLGISFYTFQTMSYTIDVYRRDVKPETNIVDFGAYVVMFPQLIAGPIVKYTDVAERLKIKKGRITLDRIDEGVSLFILGVGKKVLIANNVGALWTEISEGIGFASISTPLAWLGILAYSLQIYFDFSGYSLMAIGLGKMLGFDFPDNFNFPYISRSVTEFWRRWHITLGSWFREYVYIPLGGNRKGFKRQIVNLFIVWALTGIWHGADWNFALWGIYYFALLVLEKLWLLKHLKTGKVWPHIYTLFTVMVGWALFAITDFTQLGVFFSKLFIPQAGIGIDYYLRNYGISLLLGCLLSTRIPFRIYDKYKNITLVRGVVLTGIIVASVAYLSNATYNPFLYFRF